jgi:hypothetical protein
MRSISNLKTFMLKFLVRGYQIKIMVVCNYMKIMHRNV